MSIWRRIVAWWRDLTAVCIRCELHLPPVKGDRGSWVRLKYGGWLCPFCARKWVTK